MCHIIPSSHVFMFVRLKEAEAHRKASLLQRVWYIMQENNHPMQKNARPYRKTISNLKRKRNKNARSFLFLLTQLNII